MKVREIPVGVVVEELFKELIRVIIGEHLRDFRD